MYEISRRLVMNGLISLNKKNTRVKYLCLTLLKTITIGSSSNNLHIVEENREENVKNNVPSVCLTKNLEIYDLSVLRFQQLILDGGVKCNPGPTNMSETPKSRGRPQKNLFSRVRNLALRIKMKKKYLIL